MSNLDWERLVAERNEWVAKNFPGTDPTETCLGVIEEVGELAHSRLKRLQRIRGTEAEHLANEQDAIGDITIYLLGAINMADGLQGGAVVVDRTCSPGYHVAQMCKWAGRLYVDCEALVLGARTSSPLLIQRLIRRHCLYIIAHAEEYARLSGWEYDDLVIKTWERVSKRDWIADPTAGGEA